MRQLHVIVGPELTKDMSSELVMSCLENILLRLYDPGNSNMPLRNYVRHGQRNKTCLVCMQVSQELEGTFSCSEGGWGQSRIRTALAILAHNEDDAVHVPGAAVQYGYDKCIVSKHAFQQLHRVLSRYRLWCLAGTLLVGQGDLGKGKNEANTLVSPA